MLILNDIRSNYESFQQLINLHEKFKTSLFTEIDVSFNRWFSANMCSALGCVLDKQIQGLNFVKLSNIPQKIEAVLEKNDFLLYYGHPRTEDVHHTTIRYLKLSPKDGKFFNDYVMDELLKRTELPKMSEMVKEKITEGIYEIFVNSQIHSECDNIYTCGQFFPNKNIIEFTITDNGIGFKEKINKRFNKSLNSAQAIQWATRDKNTTKIDTSGGIGLAILKEFVVLNKGKMQIVSHDGYYEYFNNFEYLNLFSGSFPGTVVNLQFRTDDTSSYVMENELDNSQIF